MKYLMGLSALKLAAAGTGLLMIVTAAVAAPMIILGVDDEKSEEATDRLQKSTERSRPGTGAYVADGASVRETEAPTATSPAAEIAGRATKTAGPAVAPGTAAPSVTTPATSAAPVYSVTGGPLIACDYEYNDMIQITRGQVWSVECKVTSSGGYSAPTDLSCGKLNPATWLDFDPGPFQCSFVPQTVIPPAGGTVSSTMTLRVPSTADWGNYGYGYKADNPDIKVRLEPAFPLNLELRQSRISVECDAPDILHVVVNQPSAPIRCRVAAEAGFDDSVKFLSTQTFDLPWMPTVPCLLEPNVPVLYFGAAAGEQPISYRVTCSAPTEYASMRARFQASQGAAGYEQSVFSDIRVTAT